MEHVERFPRKTVRARLAGPHGFTLVELMIVIAVLGVLAAIAIPLYANVQSRARIARAQADVRTLGAAVTAYNGHMGQLPSALAVLTQVATNSEGLTAGPFMSSIPLPPQGWGAAYAYDTAAAGTFTISAAGDGTSFEIP